jgi:hypothetical protein
MLAMKCLTARIGTSDESDIEFLIKHFKFTKVVDFLDLIHFFYDSKLT